MINNPMTPATASEADGLRNCSASSRNDISSGNGGTDPAAWCSGRAAAAVHRFSRFESPVTNDELRWGA